MDIVQLLAFFIGALIVLITLLSAVQTFVLPRAARNLISKTVFVSSRRIFIFIANRARTYETRDSIMALYAPITLLSLPIVWVALVMIGYTGMFWSVGVQPLEQAFAMSGSSLLTLGFIPPVDMATTLLAFSEAILGLALIALLIAYLPVMYAAFSKRETAVSMLEVRAGSPPSAIEMFKRFHRLKRLDRLTDLWIDWENWFAEVDESHTSLAALVFFRSPQPHQSWITAAGTILDAAALAVSTIDIPRDPEADLCIRAGYLALRHIADFFDIPYNAEPSPDTAISITREEFDEACDQLAESGVPLLADRDQAWRNFSGWRVNYDTVLIAIAKLVVAPYAVWISDREIVPWHNKKIRRT